VGSRRRHHRRRWATRARHGAACQHGMPQSTAHPACLSFHTFGHSVPHASQPPATSRARGHPSALAPPPIGVGLNGLNGWSPVGLNGWLLQVGHPCTARRSVPARCQHGMPQSTAQHGMAQQRPRTMVGGNGLAVCRAAMDLGSPNHLPNPPTASPFANLTRPCPKSPARRAQRPKCTRAPTAKVWKALDEKHSRLVPSVSRGPRLTLG
jgi:hypothetical protein